MNEATLQLEVERLKISGVDLTPEQAGKFRTLLEQELEAQLAGVRPPPFETERLRLEATLEPSDPAGALARQIATRLAGALKGGG